MPQLETHISAVIVYPDRARLARTGRLALEPGLHALEIADLPLQLNADSVRAAAHGTARARLLGVQVNRAFYTDAPAEHVRELEAEVEGLQDTLRGLDAQADLLGKQRLSLEALEGRSKIFAIALASGEMGVETHLALLDSLRHRMEKLDTELRTVAVEKREAERRLQKLQNELNTQHGSRPRQRYAAVVEVEVLQAGDLAVELSYGVTGTGWKPLYDIRLVEADGRAEVELGYLAQVTQGTGEAWENVALTLSTARPVLAGRLPELDPWFVGPPPPPPHAIARQAKEGPAPALMRASRAFEAADMAATILEDAPAETVTASVDASGAAVTYAVPGQVSVPADGAPHKVTVAHITLPPKLDYLAAPKLVEAVYRRARLSNNSPYTLLPGPANLFSGDEFIGTTALELVAPQGEIELYLGVDDRIKVERELKRREVDKRLIGGKRRIQYGYEIRLENLLPVLAQVTLRDQIPVSRHEDIKVRLENSDPSPKEQTELNGLEWVFALSPGEKRAVRFDFGVEHLQGMEVAGLP
jgi:uncharacterized protein (TIGR02231 family)